MQRIVTSRTPVILHFFGQNGGIVSPHVSKTKNQRFLVLAILEKKITVCTCLLSSERCDGFPTHLDLALAPIKTNEWAMQQLRPILNSLVVKFVYIRTIHQPIGTADTPRTPRVLEVVGSISGVSVTSFLHFFAFALGQRANASVAIPAQIFIVRLLVF